jgi:diacylglycerol kinase (ATP)
MPVTPTGAILATALLGLALRSGRPRLRNPGQSHRSPRGQGAESGAEQGAGNDVKWEVDPQVDARERHGGRQAQDDRPHSRAENRDRRRGGERGGGVPRGEGRVVGDRHQRPQAGIGLGRTGTPEGVLERGDNCRSSERGRPGSEEGQRQTPAPQIAAEAQSDQQWTLHPPGRQHNEQRGEDWVLPGGGDVDQGVVEVDQRRVHGRADASTGTGLLLVVNGRASGVDDPRRTVAELTAILGELGASAEAVVTSGEADLFEALRGAVATGRRVVLVGGDGSLHAAANASLGRLPELALVPAGRANNIARALEIPTDRASALEVAAGAPARPLDALRVSTPQQTLYALEAISAGFQAEARSAYDAENSADLRQGVRALAHAVRHFTPYDLRARLDGEPLATDGAAQLFISNLPYFGFGFEVDPGADPGDGRGEAILIEASSRAALVRLLGATYRGRHLGLPGVRRSAVRRAELTEPIPLVADAVPLGTTTATVSVEPARLRVAAPPTGGGAA